MEQANRFTQKEKKLKQAVGQVRKYRPDSALMIKRPEKGTKTF
jgi:hypothetical protein